MKTYDIYNFDHRYTMPRIINTDSFRIIIKEDHCSNLKNLTKNASTSFAHDLDITPIVVKNPFKDGTFVITGTIEIDEQFAENSVLFPEVLNRKYINDITLVLSFLTGRHVYLKDEIEKYSSKSYLDGPVANNYNIYSQIKHENIKKISKYDLDTQFFNTVRSYSINDLLSLTSYCNSILDRLFTKWAKENGKSKFESSKLLNSLRRRAYEHVENSLCTKIKIKFLQFLKNEKIDTVVIKDIKARIHIDNSPSAIYKLKSFLKHYDLYPQEDNEENNAKLKWLNKIRNSVAHTGDLPKDKKISWNMRAEITTNITFLMLDIIQWYFAKIILEIDNHRLDETQKDIKNYFLTGKFRNKDVFNETYEDYMNRITNDWTENSNL